MIKFIIIVVFLLGSITILSAQQATGANTLRQVVEINGTFPAGVSEFNVTISPPLENLDKAVAFLSFEYNQQNQHRDTFRSWNFTDLSTLTIYGNDQTPSANFAVGFHGTIYELTSNSDGSVQHLEFIMGAGLPEGEFEISIPTAVNITTSFIVPAGSHHEADDSTVGVEEFTKFRIINSTAYGLEVGDTPNTGDTIYHVSVVDLNRTGITVQRGQGTIGSGESVDTITPSAYNQTNSMLFASFNTNGDFSQDPDDVAMKATINNDNSDLIFERIDTSGTNTIDYSWELIEYETGFLVAQHFNGTLSDGTSSGFEKIPIAVGNATRSWAIGTVSSPFGLGNGMSDSIVVGSFDRSTATITLENATDVELVRGTGTSSYEVGLQVIEFLVFGQVFDQDLLDVVTAVDLSQNKNVTKLTTDTIGSTDTVNTNAVFVIELSDTGDVLDVTSLNITKLNIDTVTALDETNFNISIGVLDTATILDLVDSSVIRSVELLDTTNVNDDLQFEITKALTDLSTVLDDPDKSIEKTIADITTIIDQADTSVIRQILELDTVQANDEVRLEIIKAIIDVVANSDELNFSLNKLLADSASVSDLIDSDTDTDVNQLDLITANDLVILDVTRQLSDVASAIDDLDLVPTKVFIDTTSISDTVQSSKDSDVTETDTVVTQDEFVIDVTKLILDVSTIQDAVVVLKIQDIVIIDTVTVTDPNIFFTISTNQTAGGSPSSGGGGGVPTFQRLVGLSILSELFNVVPKDNVPSDFVISTFGLMQVDVKIDDIQPDSEFQSWFQFQTFPNTLDFDTEVDSSRASSDPARFTNTALQSFILTVPDQNCAGIDPFASAVPCIDPLVYEVPLTFTFTKGGVDFKEKHFVTIDATERVSCDIICQIVDFLVVNYWWLAGIVVAFMMMYFLASRASKRGIRTARRVSKSHFHSFSADTPKRKFKRGKGR